MRKLTLLLLGLVFFVAHSFAQRTITGKVTDENGLPIPNATVLIKGSTSGTTTKEDGSFSLSLPSNAKALIFSSVNFEATEIPVGNSATLQVKMTSLDKALTEVVVTGYGQQKKRQFTGAATTLSSKAVETVPVPSFDQMLQGRVPGLQVISGSGQPGASANVHIRGVSSINAAFVQPLYVIDGIPTPAGDFATLNPNDFESITVLKDASAAAMYGSRGGLGVIVITTKRGKSGQTNFTYRSQYGFTQRPQPSQFNQMDSREMLAYEGFVGTFAPSLTAPGWVYAANNPANAGLPATSPAGNPYAASKARYAFILDSLGSNNVNYYDILFRTGTSMTHEINMSGGNANTRYYLSIGYFGQEGTDRKSNLDRYTARFNLDNTIGKFSVQFNSTIGYAVTDFNEGQFYAGNGTANPFAMVWRAKPYENPFRPDGTPLTGTSSALSPKAMANLIDRADNSKWIDKQIKSNLGLTLTYRITPKVSVKQIAGLDASHNYGQGYINPASYTGTLQTYQAGLLNESMVNRLQLISTTGLLYADRFGKHDFDLGGYFEVIRQWNNGFGMYVYNLDPRLSQTGQNGGTLVTNGAATIAQNASSAKSGYGIRSFFANARYTFDGKYTLSGVIRRDGTSRIYNTENKEINSYSAGFTWEAIKENFMKSQSFLTDLRLRFTYGKVPNIGSITAGSYGVQSLFYTVPGVLSAQLPSFSAAAYAGSSLSGIAPGVANPNLKIESVNKANIGVDLALWKNRIRLTVEAYRNITKDLFVNQILPATSGFYNTGLAVNAGTMSNKGLEFDFSIDIVKGRNVDLTFHANHSINKNKIEDLGSVTEYPAGTGIIKEGLPYGTHLSYWYLGADPATGAPRYKKSDGTTTTNINEAGQFHEFGTWMPKHVGGFDVMLRVSRITVTALFSYQFDVRRYNNVQNWVTQGDATYTGAVTQSRILLTDQWRKPGDVAMIQAPNYSRQFTSYDITDAKFLRFRNLNVAYSLPEISIGSIRLIKSGRFYVQGQNLAIWSPWSGLDPEDDNNISLAEFPNAKAFVVGLDINF